MGLDGVCVGEQVQYFEGCKLNFDESRSELSKRLLGIIDKYYLKNEHGVQPKIVLSAENLSCSNEFASLFDGLDTKFDIKVVIYIRRQDEYLLSFWQQWYLKVEEDFWTWVLNHIRIIGDWYYTLEPWMNLFGKENIVVRNLSRKNISKGHLLLDFAEQLGVDTEGTNTEIHENISFNDAVTSLASSVSDIFDGMHDHRFYSMVAEWGGPPTLKKSPSYLITVAQRKALLLFYSRSNDRIKKIFFSELGDKELFDPVDESICNYDTSSTVDGRIEVLTRLIYGLYLENH